MPKEEKEKKDQNSNSEQSVLEESKIFRERQYTRAVSCILIFIFLAWLLGRLEFGFFWLLALIILVFIWWRNKISWLLELVCKDADLEARRDRAFQDTETVEWLNFILNRWWVHFVFFTRIRKKNTFFYFFAHWCQSLIFRTIGFADDFKLSLNVTIRSTSVFNLSKL